jgi:hypothetical protein
MTSTQYGVQSGREIKEHRNGSWVMKQVHGSDGAVDKETLLEYSTCITVSV